jgi:photosystem II stability/assembly factor-like uncharacterized protein
MSLSLFVATPGRGVACAERNGGEWRLRRSLENEDVRCLATAGDTTILAGTQGHGLFRSEDGGRRWFPSGLNGLIVKSLAAAPADPRTVYAGTKPPGLFLSHDGGASWTELEGFRAARRWWWRQPAERPTTPYVQALAVSPADPGVVLAGMEAGAVVRSTDGGRSWSSHLKRACRDCHALVFHARGEWAYQGGGGALFSKPGVAISRVGGASWGRPDAGIDRKYGWAVAADPSDPKVCYVALSPGAMKAHSPGRADAYIFRTTDARAWHKLSGGLPQPLDHMPYALIADPGDPGHVYCGLANGHIWHSADRGDTWTRMPIEMGAIERSLVAL